jgi:hypothetical protein
MIIGEKCLLDRLQAVLNDHVTPLLRDRLHWFKLCLLTFKALHGMAPQYIADLAVRHLRPIVVIVFDQRHTATSKFERLVPSLAIRYYRLQVNAHGTSSRWTFDLLSPLIHSNESLNVIYFVSPLAVNFSSFHVQREF